MMTLIIISLQLGLVPLICFLEVRQVTSLRNEMSVDIGRVVRILQPIRISVGDLPRQGIGVALYERRARKGSLEFLSKLLTVCIALSA